VSPLSGQTPVNVSYCRYYNTKMGSKTNLGYYSHQIILLQIPTAVKICKKLVQNLGNGGAGKDFGGVPIGRRVSWFLVIGYLRVTWFWSEAVVAAGTLAHKNCGDFKSIGRDISRKIGGRFFQSG